MRPLAVIAGDPMSNTQPDGEPLQRMREASLTLFSAVRALAEQGQPGRADAVALCPSPARAELVDELATKYRLPRVYAEFLRNHASHDFSDTGLVCRSVACWLSTADGFAQLHGSYATQAGWPKANLVVAGEYEGCYYLERTSSADDGAVYFLEHSTGSHEGDFVAGSFAGFLEVVATSSFKKAGTADSELSRAARTGDVAALELLVKTREDAAHAWRTAADVLRGDVVAWIEARFPDACSSAHRAMRIQALAKRAATTQADPKLEFLNRLMSQGPPPLELTPALVAVSVGGERALEVMDALLARGAAVEPTGSNRQSPLIMAAWFQQPVLVRRLLEAGANVDAQDDSGETALMKTAFRQGTEVALLLLDRGAATGKKNRAGETVLDIADRKDNKELVALLKARGVTSPWMTLENVGCAALGLLAAAAVWWLGRVVYRAL